METFFSYSSTAETFMDILEGTKGWIFELQNKRIGRKSRHKRMSSIMVLLLDLILKKTLQKSLYFELSNVGKLEYRTHQVAEGEIRERK